ncbi:MAG: hypothetical protein KF763_05230 [Cyclobacteriaceae bacterium]|nr:hypothetical protein [Cyclobacteriaceae bacterium]
MAANSTQKNELQLAGSYVSLFQVALTNLYLWQMEQTKNRQKRTKP